MVRVELGKRDFVWMGFVVVLIGVGFVYGYGGSNPAVMGHSAGEIEVEVDDTLCNAITGHNCGVVVDTIPVLYDSGWIVAPSAGSGVKLTHNLGTKDFSKVSVVGAFDSSGSCQVWVTGATSSGTGVYGNWVSVISDTEVVVSSGYNGAVYNYGYGGGCPTGIVSHIRVRIW
jgi:hypothetical protein